MEAMRQSWSDDRLDSFAAETAQRFDEVGRRFDKVDQRLVEVDRRFVEVDRRFEDVDRRLGEVNGRLERLEDRVEGGFYRINDRIDHLHRSIWILGSGALVTLVVGFAGIIIGQ
jgi:archaellum component FlaC